MVYSGRCHCGALSYAYETAVPPRNWAVRACQCTFCRAHQALTTSDPAGSLAFQIHDGRRLVRYRFGLRVTDFLLCAECGVYVAAAITTPRGRYGIINVNALQAIPPGIPAPRPMAYEGESESERTARREARWTPIIGDL